MDFIHQTEEEFLRDYEADLFKKPNASVDTVIYTIFDNHLHALILKRSEHPFKELWSLVGGFIDVQLDCDLEATAKRKLEEKTGVRTPYLEQFSTIGNNIRDPRGWSITTVYFALISHVNVHLYIGKGASEIKWSRLAKGKVKEKLAFDHAEILSKCTERLRNKVLYTSLPVHLMQEDFTLGELQKVYEIILDYKLDHKSFRRRMLSAGILEETGAMRHDGRRPAHLYRLKKQHCTHFFIRNIEGAS